MVQARLSKLFVDQVVEVLRNLHEKIIIQSGGEKGIRDEGGLYNSVYKILNLQEKRSDDPNYVGAFVYKELSRRHHFNDGNKRTAHVFAKIVLFMMGFHFKIEYKTAVSFIIKIAEYESKVTFEEIKKWMKPHLTQIQQEDIAKYINEIIIDITDDS